MIRGKINRSKKIGNSFEDLFLRTCTRYLRVTRIPDGCRRLGVNKLIQVKSPFDWICSYNGRTALIDTKTTSGKSFPNSKICTHQVKELIKHASASCLTGYVIWLRNPNLFLFADSMLLHRNLEIQGSIDENSEGIVILGRLEFDARLIFKGHYED